MTHEIYIAIDLVPEYIYLYFLASVIGNSNGLSQTTISETLQTCRPRSKSARKKQKLSMPTRSSIECSQERPPRRTCCNFFVPAYGQHENGGYQDQKHFGLIEGMGGGEGEIIRLGKFLTP
jgi:hypothetical protein